MNDFIPALTHFSAAAAGALFSAIWQGALLAAVVALLLRLLPGLTAAARSVVWLNVFVLLALLHLTPLLAGAPAGAALVPAHAVRLHPAWSLVLAALWLAISLLRAAQLVWGAIHLHSLARRAVPVAVAPGLQPLLTLHGRDVRLSASPQVARPSVLGFLHPRILLPPELLQMLSPTELRQVVLHEMEHLRRADDWTNLLQKLALVLFPLNPALAWVERRLCAERELACDDRVLHSSGRKAYALCLAHLAEASLMRRGFSLVLGLWERRPELVRRVHRILGEPARSMNPKPAIFATGGIVAGVLASALVLARAPQVVCFAPAAELSAQTPALAPFNARELGRQLGGAPQLVKAQMPGSAQPRLKPAVTHQKPHQTPPAVRLAGLTAPRPPTGTLLIMTEWTGLETPPRLVVTFTQTRSVRPPVLVPVSYAVVRTPAGWLVIQI